MRLIPVGLGVVTGLQVIATAVAYPVLTLGVGLAVSAHKTLASPDPGARTIFVLSGLPMAFTALIMAAVFAAVPLGASVAGAIVVGKLGSRRAAKAPVPLLLKFGAGLVLINVLALFAGTLVWPVWFYSEKLASLAPVWPLALCSTLNAVLDATVAGIVLRSQLKAR